jgi:hypothetical protein
MGLDRVPFIIVIGDIEKFKLEVGPDRVYNIFIKFKQGAFNIFEKASVDRECSFLFIVVKAPEILHIVMNFAFPQFFRP